MKSNFTFLKLLNYLENLSRVLSLCLKNDNKRLNAYNYFLRVFIYIIVVKFKNNSDLTHFYVCDAL